MIGEDVADPDGLPPDVRSFVEELALCVATYSDKGPALLWSEGGERLLSLHQAWAQAADTSRIDASAPDALTPEPVAAGAETDQLTTGLSHLLGCQVRASYRVLPAGANSGVVDFAGEEFILTLAEGACRCRLWPPAGQLRGDAVLDVRLRAGESLFVPGSCVYRLSDVHRPTVILTLVLGGQG